MSDTEWTGKPKLATTDERCGNCLAFLPGKNTDAVGDCLALAYMPNRYPNQTCVLFSRRPK